MDCKEVKRADIIEKYLLAELSGAEQDAFERHYFECADCLAELQTYRALQSELAGAASVIRAEPLGTRGQRAQVRRWVWAISFALVFAAIGLAYWQRSSKTGIVPSASHVGPLIPEVRPIPSTVSPQPPTDFLNELAQVEPPQYEPLILRGGEDEATRRFRRAMVHYSKGEYAAAITGLRVASDMNRNAPNIRFFLGICYLMTGQTEAAINSLQKTISLGDSQYSEESHFYLAKSYLRKGDAGAAQDELTKMIQIHGDLESEARELLRRLQAAVKTER